MAIRSLGDLDIAVFNRVVTDPKVDQDGIDKRKIDTSFCQTLDVPVLWSFRELRDDPITAYPLITFFHRSETQLLSPFRRTDTVLETIEPGVVRRRAGPIWFVIDYQVSFQSRNWDEFQAMNWNLRHQVFEFNAGQFFFDIDGISRQILLASSVDRHNREAQYYARDLVFGLTLPLFPIQLQEPGATQETIREFNIGITYQICDPSFPGVTEESETQVETF